MTDSQWAAAVPNLKNAIVDGPVSGTELMGIFMGIPPPTQPVVQINQIVLEISPTGYSKYKIDRANNKMFFKVDSISVNTFLEAIVALGNGTDHAKVDARDTVRMAKAPVNGKAFAARDAAWYWLGYFLLET